MNKVYVERNSEGKVWAIYASQQEGRVLEELAGDSVEVTEFKNRAKPQGTSRVVLWELDEIWKALKTLGIDKPKEK